jgi:hypothetical protein
LEVGRDRLAGGEREGVGAELAGRLDVALTDMRGRQGGEQPGPGLERLRVQGGQRRCQHVLGGVGPAEPGKGDAALAVEVGGKNATRGRRALGSSARRLMIASASSIARRVAASSPARAWASASRVTSQAWVLAVASARVKPWVVPSSRRSLAWGRSR